jgi:hypothetical protein
VTLQEGRMPAAGAQHMRSSMRVQHHGEEPVHRYASGVWRSSSGMEVRAEQAAAAYAAYAGMRCAHASSLPVRAGVLLVAGTFTARTWLAGAASCMSSHLMSA